MYKVNITELRNRLSFYLAKVKQGEEIIVCERDVPFAKIVPLRNSDGKLLFKLPPALAGGKLAKRS